MCACLGIKTPIDEMMGNLPGVTRVAVRSGFDGGSFVIQDITLAPGAMIPFHCHMKRREGYWWLSGEGVLVMSGQEHKFSEKGFQRAFIRRKVVHGLRNDSQEPFKFRAIYNPLCEDGTTCVFGDTYLD